MIKKMEVAGVTVDPATKAPILVLRDEEMGRTVPIWIGIFEATAILSRLERVTPPRPMTHDLLKNVLESLGGRLEKVIIHDLRDNTYIAKLIIEVGDKLIEIDSRPSDAVALALRTESPVYMEEEIIEKSKVSVERVEGEFEGKEGESEEDKERWKKILEDMNPEDFGKYKM